MALSIARMASEKHNATRPLRVEETEASFVAADVAPVESEADRFGALASWTDARVKQQTYVAAIGLLCLSALAVLIFVFS